MKVSLYGGIIFNFSIKYVPTTWGRGGIKFPRIFYPPPPIIIHCQGVGVVPSFQLPLMKKHLLIVAYPLTWGGG